MAYTMVAHRTTRAKLGIILSVVGLRCVASEPGWPTLGNGASFRPRSEQNSSHRFEAIPFLRVTRDKCAHPLKCPAARYQSGWDGTSGGVDVRRAFMIRTSSGSSKVE